MFYLRDIINKCDSMVIFLYGVCFCFSLGSKGGEWFLKGCKMIGLNVFYIICECNYMIDFVVFVDISKVKVSLIVFIVVF